MARSPLINPDGSLRIEKKGLKFSFWHDFYYFLISASWFYLLGIISALFLISNMMFACGYWLSGNGISNAQPGSFGDAFFFSVQTMSTIGYGTMSPQNMSTHILVVSESIYGFLFLALITGVIFSKFSRVNARVLFSQNMLTQTHNGQRVLTFRAANQRSSNIVEAQIRVSLALNETTQEGERFRQIYDLKLTRDRSPLFALVWNVFHPLDESSPLWQKNQEDLEESEAVFIITFMGIDDTMGETVHTRHLYSWQDIYWDAYFKNLIIEKKDGSRMIDYTNFHLIREAC